MPLDQTLPAGARNAAPPRTAGALVLSSKNREGVSCIDVFRSSGAARAVFPRRADTLEAIVVNTSGGLTGGDRFDIDARAGSGSRMVLTTQAAERAYRSAGGLARVSTRLRADGGAALAWLPQELIVYDGAGLTRRLDADLAPDAEFLMAEAVIFGRTAMGETVRGATFRDRVRVTRGGRPVYSDAVALTGDLHTRLDAAAVMPGMSAMAAALYVGPRAEACLAAVRALLPANGGASLLAPDILALRLLAPDGFLLRETLCPMLETLSGATLPTSWRL